MNGEPKYITVSVGNETTEILISSSAGLTVVDVARMRGIQFTEEEAREALRREDEAKKSWKKTLDDQ